MLWEASGDNLAARALLVDRLKAHIAGLSAIPVESQKRP
jgi:hypothetical protein